MRTNTETSGLRILVASSVIFSIVLMVNAAGRVGNMQVEYSKTPLGIDVQQPRFSWQMAVAKGQRGYSQSAYRIEAKDPQRKVVWDTRKSEGAISLGIKYAGSPLKAATRYHWTVTVWDQTGAKATGTSWFETGLMNPDPNSSAWSGAQWIGGDNEDLVLYAPYLAIFNLKYAQTIAEASSRASFVYGANDSRLMDRYKNIYQVESGRDQSYIKLELDVSAVDGTPTGKAKLNVYRAGYKETDTPSKPLQSFEVSTEFINMANRHAEHVIGFSSAFGRIDISIDGKTTFTSAPGGPPPGGRGGRGGAPNSVNLNPVGAGGNFLPFGMLCDIGFAVDPGQKATFRDVVVLNNRFPNHILFGENLAGPGYKGIFADLAAAPDSGFSVGNGRYVLNGGSKGLFAVRNPSKNSTPMLRTEFKTSNKKIAGARLYVTSRGIYEIFVNGKRVGDDYYNPGLTQYNMTHMYQTYDVTGLDTRRRKCSRRHAG